MATTRSPKAALLPEERIKIHLGPQRMMGDEEEEWGDIPGLYRCRNNLVDFFR